jgi:hypothetical protein
MSQATRKTNRLTDILPADKLTLVVLHDATF